MDFLVLPRMVALILMMPLLTVYADVLGIFGGVLVGVGMLDICRRSTGTRPSLGCAQPESRSASAKA